GGANVGGGRNQQVLCRFYVGTPLEQRRRQTRGNAWRRVLFGQRRAPWNSSGVTPEQQIDLVLLNGDLTLQLRNRRGSTRAVRDGRVQLEPVGGTTREPRLVKSHGLVVKLHGAPGYFELQIELAQGEIGLSYVGHKSDKDTSLRLLRREEYRRCGFRVRPNFSKK